MQEQFLIHAAYSTKDVFIELLAHQGAKLFYGKLSGMIMEG
jgi:hypothetical protein